MTKPPPMPEPPMPTYEALWAKEAAYWLAHAKELRPSTGTLLA